MLCLRSAHGEPLSFEANAEGLEVLMLEVRGVVGVVADVEHEIHLDVMAKLERVRDYDAALGRLVRVARPRPSVSMILLVGHLAREALGLVLQCLALLHHAARAIQDVETVGPVLVDHGREGDALPSRDSALLGGFAEVDEVP